MDIKVFLANLLAGVLGGLIAGIALTYLFKPYLDQTLTKDRVSKIFKSEGFFAVIIILAMVLISVLKPSTAPYIYGHGLGSYSYVKDMEKIYTFIPLMKKEMSDVGHDGVIDEHINLIDLDLREKMYYMDSNKEGSFSYKQNDVTKAMQFTGIHKVYYANGNVYSESKFNNGERLEDGYRSYYSNGVIRAEIIKDKTMTGLFQKIVKYYYNSGSVWCEYRYYDGHRLIGFIYDRNGNIVEQGEHVFYAVLIPGYYERVERQLYDLRYNPSLFYSYGTEK